jgi:UDP-galactopyranose mutase
MYDYVIVGSGLFGSVFAHEMKKNGKNVLVIEKKEHIGGNIYTEKISNINVHKYGAHIFHTSDKRLWDYVNQFSEFLPFINSPIANYKGEIYNLPFNMNTFNKLWGVVTPEEAAKKIESQKGIFLNKTPENLEEQAISLVGYDIYNKLIKGYTEKQWGKLCSELPAFIIKRLPVRFTYNNNYFNDTYQGIPKDGYTKIIENLLNGIDVKLNTDFFDDKEHYESCAKKVLYTGPIDRLFNFNLGYLEYRSLEFENQVLDIENYQGNAVVNYTDSETKYTRIIEHKHFENSKSSKTVITKEYPKDWNVSSEPYYPVNDDINNELYRQYKDLTKELTNYIFGGRLAEYRYYDMHNVISSALSLVEKELNNEKEHI